MPPSTDVWRRFVVDGDIDILLNPFIPHNHLNLLPTYISHWFGHREDETPDPPALVRLPLIFIATVAGLCLVAGVYNYAPGIAEWNPPILIASLGASAILNYNVIHSPLSQPRNVIVGQTLAAVVGVGISKLFQLSSDFEHIEWVAAAVGCACSSVVMSLANCLHPPGGATAVLASADSQVIALGWRFVPLVLLASSLMTLVACIFNNLARQYPLYWWTHKETGWLLPRSASRRKCRNAADGESNDVEKDLKTTKPASLGKRSVSSENTLSGGTSTYGPRRCSFRSQLPVDMVLSAEEIGVLQRLEKRLQEHTNCMAST